MRNAGMECDSLNAAGHHDRQALYDEFQTKIRRYLTRLIGATDAEALTQEVFVKVSRHFLIFPTQTCASPGRTQV
jgi:DNA-directed RNA polymerase specialized sigma24 family protein